MPKKTKQKKIIASYRNKLKQELQSTTNINTPDNKQYPKKTSIPPEKNDTDNVAFYFRKDFTKSLFLIAGIITLELIFYFASMSSSLRSILKFIP